MGQHNGKQRLQSCRAAPVAAAAPVAPGRARAHPPHRWGTCAMQLELLSTAWLCLLLALLGLRTSFFRLGGEYGSKGPKDPDGMAARFQRAHGNLSEWIGAYAALCIISSDVVLGARGPLAEFAGYVAAAGAAGITVHRAGMIILGLRQFHWTKMAGMTTFYLAIVGLGVRCLVGLAQ